MKLGSDKISFFRTNKVAVKLIEKVNINQNKISKFLNFFAAFECRCMHTSAYLSRVVRKPAFCICENKDSDQLRGNREADQRLCFRYTDSTIPLLSKSEISSI